MNRARMAERAAQRPAKPANMRHFPPMHIPKPAPAPVRNRRAVKMTGAMRSGDGSGRPSQWTRSPYAPSWGWH